MLPRVLGVLGGSDMGDERLVAWASSATHLYAADSGADRLIALGFSPVVVGDFDSFASRESSQHLRLVRSPDESTTDCDKLLALVAADGHTGLTLACTEGDLPDHVLATYSSVSGSSLAVRLAFRRGIGRIVGAGGSFEVEARAGQRVSLMPLVACDGVSLQGVRWPMEGDRLEVGGKVSVSNEALGGPVRARVESGLAMLFWETDEVAW